MHVVAVLQCVQPPAVGERSGCFQFCPPTLWPRTSLCIFTCVPVPEFLWKPISLSYFPQGPCSEDITLHSRGFFWHRYMSTFLDDVHVGVFGFVHFIFVLTPILVNPGCAVLHGLSPRTVILQFRGESIIGVFPILLVQRALSPEPCVKT